MLKISNTRCNRNNQIDIRKQQGVNMKHYHISWRFDERVECELQSDRCGATFNPLFSGFALIFNYYFVYFKIICLVA